MARKLYSIIIAIFLFSILYAGYFLYKKKDPYEPKPVDFSVQQNGTTQILPEGEKEILSETVKINVPFLVQAPFANWDALHEEACEEASLIMLNHFINKTNINSAQSGEEEIQKLIAWEEKNGYEKDVTIKELAEIAKHYYKFNNAIGKYDITVDDIKYELSNGRPVIVPAYGKILPNPYFRNGGPNYHMLVITGYDSQGFITNDPGTKRGQDFRYTFDALYNAIHDYDSSSMLNGPKAMLVFE